jgi:hypothetical protein
MSNQKSDEIKQILNKCLQEIEEKTGILYRLTLYTLSEKRVRPIFVGDLSDRPGRYRVVMQKMYGEKYNKDHTLKYPKRLPKKYLTLNGEYDTITDIEIKIKEMGSPFYISYGNIVSGRQIRTKYGEIQVIK